MGGFARRRSPSRQPPRAPEPGSGGAVAGQWRGSGGAVAGQWRGSGGAVAGQWRGSGGAACAPASGPGLARILGISSCPEPPVGHYEAHEPGHCQEGEGVEGWAGGGGRGG